MMGRMILLINCFLLSGIMAYAQEAERKWLNIVYIGNGITQGALIDEPRKNAPPVKASIYLKKQDGIGEVKYSNQGVSGNTTIDFLPQTNTYFPKVKAVADKFKEETWATLLFSIMLGTNDSAIKGPNGAPVSAGQYYKNLKAIIDELIRLYPQCEIIIHRPIWYSPNTYNNAMYLKEGLQRLESYLPEIKRLAEEYQQVYVGDTNAFDYFKANYETLFIPEKGNAGTFYLHPNASGAQKLGEFWGEAILNRRNFIIR